MVECDDLIKIYRGDVVKVGLNPTKGSEIRGDARPCIIVQNDIGNLNSLHTIIVPVIDAHGKKIYPFQVLIEQGEGGLKKDSIAKCEQVRVIDKKRILKKIGHLRENLIEKVDTALLVSLDL